MRYSRAYWSVKPPPVLTPNCANAVSSWPWVTPSARRAVGWGATRNWRTSPPMGMTWATPGMERMRGRIVKSAISRSCMADTVSPVTATITICPMIEEIGPIIGLTVGGSCERAIARRSETCWRLR